RASIASDPKGTANQTSSPTSTLRGTLGLSAQSLVGTGVVVAVVDSGLTPGPEFDDRIVGFYDFTHNNGRSSAPVDEYGHGTHVAGLIAGNGTQSGNLYRGVAPNARLVGFKVLDQNGAGSTSDVINAIEYITKHNDHLGVDIINPF